MHRSASTSRASDEFLVSISPQTKGSPGLKPAVIDQLLTYDPLSEVSKKEASRNRTSENAVHFIPLILIVCAIVLWSFSHPAVVVANKNDSVVSLTKELKIDDFNNQSSLPAPKATKRLNNAKQIVADKSVGSIQNNSE